MVKFCPECGIKLEKEYKFCPECGFDLSAIDLPRGSVQSSGREEESKHDAGVLVCEVCGEENTKDSDVCVSCGARLKDTIVRKSDMPGGKRTETKHSSQQVVNKVSDKSKKKQTSQQTDSKQNQYKSPKKLNTLRIVTLSAIGLGIALVILIFSGILNSLIIPGTPKSEEQPQANSSIDLSNLQRINTLENQITANPKDTVAILELAHLKNDNGMYQQAIVDYRKYLTLVPGDPDARIDMGVCYYNLQDYNNAIKEMETAIKYDPKHQIGYLNLGIVNLTAGNFEKSREWLKKAVALDPNSDYGKKAEELLKSHSNTNKMNGGN